MAVAITGTSKTFVGTGVSSVYAPAFYANSSDQVVVRVNGVLKAIGDDYVVSGVGAAGGVNITANFASGAAVIVSRVTPITQLIDTQNNETILEDVLDAEFDKLTMIAQEQDSARVNLEQRAIRVPDGEIAGVLPGVASRVGKFLSFDADGKALMASGVGTDGALRADLLGSGGAALVGTLQSGANTVSRSAQAKLREFVSVADFAGADPTGVASSLAAFNAAAATGANVYVPRGSWNIPAATASAFWILDAGAVIVGLADIGIPTVSVINDTSRLTGKMIRYGSASILGPGLRVGDTRGWMEKTIRGTTESYATFVAVSPAGGIAGSFGSRTSDSPSKINTAMSCIGTNAYAVNDTPLSDGQTAYAGYKEAQRKANCGLAWIEEGDIVNFGPDTIDIKPNTALTYNAYTGGYVVNSGGGHAGVFPASVALTFQYNGATFRRGIVFNSGTIDAATNEAIAMASQHRIAWYDSLGANVGFMDAANLTRTIDSAGAFNVSDTVIRKGGSGAASASGSFLYRNMCYGWTGAALVNGAYQRVRQTSAVSGGNAQFAYEFAAYTAAGVEMGISLGAAGGDVFAPMNDNIIYLGGGSNRWRTVFAGTGTISTSDGRKKKWLGGPTEADRRAARRIIDELGWYQWLEAVEKEGDDARRHYGVRVQRVFQILAEEGIEELFDIDFPADIFVPEDRRPSFRSAFLTFDTWDEEWRDEFEEVDDIEEVEIVLTKRTPTGETDEDGEEVLTVTKEPHTIAQPIKRSVPTGERTKVKSAGNVFGLRSDQLSLYLVAALVAK